MKSDNHAHLPLVSIVIACFNDGKYLNDSVRSVLSQTYPRLEIIIVDDGSTDLETKKILTQSKWPMTTIINIEHRGAAVARNIGISFAKGKYILSLDADDRIHSSYIDKAVSILETQKEVGIVYCQAEYFGKVKGHWDLPPYSFERMLLDNIIFVTALFRKTDWQDVGGFDEGLIHGMEDYDFWLSLLEIDKQVVQIPEVLFFYRIREGSRSRRLVSDKKQLQETYQRIYRNHPELYKEHQEIYVTVLRHALIDQIFWRQSFDILLRNGIIKASIKAIMSLLNNLRIFIDKIRDRIF
jgi:glycosyltransferase involved in cell wall biosynthesis